MEEKKMHVSFVDKKPKDEWQTIESKEPYPEDETMYLEDVEEAFKSEAYKLLTFVIKYAERSKQAGCLAELYRATFAWESVPADDLYHNFCLKRNLFKAIKNNDEKLLKDSDKLFKELGFSSKAPMFTGQNVNYLFTHLKRLVEITEIE